ncbi:MAG: hypothetical protein EBR81_17325, partial [Proteobacteria bacterium]|nr:hypothetical protein [Pseudomonadota bacterium]
MANTKVSTVYDIPAGTKLSDRTGITVGGKVTVETTYNSSGRLITSGDGAPVVTSSDLSTATSVDRFAGANATFNDVSSVSSTDFLGASVSITPRGAISINLSQANPT